jgi:signal peptidase II
MFKLLAHLLINQRKKASAKKFYFFVISIISTFIITTGQLVEYIIRLKGGFYICNTGISFGIRIPLMLFYISFAFTILIGVTFFFFSHNKSIIPVLGLSFVAGGAISNLIDRILIGCVTDYISLFSFFPVFNLADTFIFLGASILTVYFFKDIHP